MNEIGLYNLVEERCPVITRAASASYEANRIYLKAISGPTKVPWDEAKIDERINYVKFTLFLLKNLDVDQKTLHHAWCKHVSNNGWKYGSEYSKEKKLDPNLLPYNKLSIGRRRIDIVSSTVARNILLAYKDAGMISVPSDDEISNDDTSCEVT